MDFRQLKGLEIAARSRLAFEDGAWSVPSQSGNGKYRVTLHPSESCTCEDFSLRQEPCKHVYAARIVQERDHGGKRPEIDFDSIPKKPTYRQNWPAYTEAQTTEKHRFQVLLADLCRGVLELPYGGTGRRRIPTGDAVFAMAYKVYSTFSARRFMCDLRDAHAKGYLSRPVHHNSINGYMENPDLTPILRSLVTQSSLPLRSLETTFAPDSSGFSTSRFVKWFDHKYGIERQGHAWVKVHLMVGTKTNVVTAVEILGPTAPDSPQLPALLETTAKHFNVKEVPADKGYSSVDNIEAIAKAGAVPYIPFKVNATGGAGGLWEKMFHFYNAYRTEFLARYHQRSKVESTFSMIKAKFRDHVRSRTDAAMVNEVLCKIICHNVCCVIQSQCELGIEAAFWAGSRNETKGA